MWQRDDGPVDTYNPRDLVLSLEGDRLFYNRNRTVYEWALGPDGTATLLKARLVSGTAGLCEEGKSH